MQAEVRADHLTSLHNPTIDSAAKYFAPEKAGWLPDSERILITGSLPFNQHLVYLGVEFGMRILIVEDEKKVAEMIARGLKAERHAVDVSNDGEAGWELASLYDYDLVILDLMLPGLGGNEVLQRIRRKNQQVPILILTARDATDEKVRNFEAGADDYLTKPFAFAELLVRIKALLRRGPVNRSSVLRVGDLEVDRLSQQVRRAGKRIELTAKEYSLLEYLSTSPGRVFSRTMIIEHVWDQSFEGLTNIVDVYVRHLRAKMDDPFPNKLIRTVRGVGYCLSDEVEA
jgi:two-component system copper resistance phosphate regulon response regulator CusR